MTGTEIETMHATMTPLRISRLWNPMGNPDLKVHLTGRLGELDLDLPFRDAVEARTYATGRGWKVAH